MVRTHRGVPRQAQKIGEREETAQASQLQRKVTIKSLSFLRDIKFAHIYL